MPVGHLLHRLSCHSQLLLSISSFLTDRGVFHTNDNYFDLKTKSAAITNLDYDRFLRVCVCIFHHRTLVVFLITTMIVLNMMIDDDLDLDPAQSEWMWQCDQVCDRAAHWGQVGQVRYWDICTLWLYFSILLGYIGILWYWGQVPPSEVIGMRPRILGVTLRCRRHSHSSLHSYYKLLSNMFLPGSIPPAVLADGFSCLTHSAAATWLRPFLDQEAPAPIIRILISRS